MYIVNLNYQKSLDEVDLLLKAHIDWLKPYIANGTFIAAGRKNPITGGVFLVKDMPLPEIEQIAHTESAISFFVEFFKRSTRGIIR